MISLAFDQSLANSGWSVLTLLDNQVSLLEYGIIKTNNNNSFIERLILIETNLASLVEKFKPNFVFLEEVHCPRNSPYAWPQLLVVESIYKLWLTKHNIPFYSINSKKTNKQSWRSLLNITSSEKKATRLLFNKLKINEHIADSLAINLAGVILHSKELNYYTINQLINDVNN